MISHLGQPKVLTNGLLGSIDTGMSKVVMVPLNDLYLHMCWYYNFSIVANEFSSFATACEGLDGVT